MTVSTMRAAVYHGPQDLRIETIDQPKPAAGEALVRVLACGVCGTDRRIFAGGHRYYPDGARGVPGHEIVGEVVANETGTEVPDGPVVVAPNFGCGKCMECLSGNNNRCSQFQAIGITMNGGFSDYVLVPALAVAQGNIMALDDVVDPALGVLVEPLATVVRGQEPLAIGPRDTVLVVGGGPIGLLHVALARLKGAAKVILADRWDRRVAIAREIGADVALNVRRDDLAERLMAETAGRGADVVIVAAPSHAAQAEALRQAAVGGRVSFFAGLPKAQPSTELETNLIHYRELTVSGTTACSTRDCRIAMEIITGGRMTLSPLLTLSLPLEETVSAFTSDPHDHLKISITP
ncbi:zinc-binding dehydrogenase [Bauldia sp.]|uniref:zinc-binding dehydrogenase n=1 Tax=Bauldia sp. TaxID=2575872 RepID=UPI003BA9A4B3